MLIFTGVVSALIILAGVGVVLWYFWNTRRIDEMIDEEEQEELTATEEPEQQLPEPECVPEVMNRTRHQTDFSLDDDVFLPSPTEDK